MNIDKILELFEGKITKNIVYTGPLNAIFIKKLAEIAENLYFFNKLKVNPFKEIEKITVYVIQETLQVIKNWPKTRGKADVIIFGFGENHMDVKIHLSFWMPLLRKGGLFIILNANEEMEQGALDYVETTDPDFYDITFDKENGFLILEHK